MIRWPLLIIGIGLMVCALIARFQQPALASNARRVTVTDAIALAGGSTKEFIDLEAAVDAQQRIYSTGTEVSRPVYTGKPTDQVYPLRPELAKDELEKYVGTMVQIETALEPRYLRLQTVRDRALEEKQILNERLLAPIRGTGFRIWALSAVFEANHPQGKSWLSQNRVQGYLTEFKEVEANRSAPKFSHDLGQIYRTVEQEFGQPVPEDAFLLLTDNKNAPQPVTYFYSPIRGSQDTLFCELTPATAANLTTPMRGVLEPADLKLYADFEKVLGRKLPGRIAILRQETAQSFNQRRAAGVRDVFLTGAVLALLGLVGIGWKRMRRPTKA
ncbi:MAG: hypothetical protein AB1813_05055 [Verrucomicrobiota bacterium]